MSTQSKHQITNDLSYNVTVKTIIENIQKAQTDTLAGAEILKEVYKNLCESKNPILTLKPFVTGAEKIAPDDIKLIELVNFIKKKITGNGDLNFLINLVKEEHFENLTRAGHPSPESTIKEFEDQFNKSSNVIEAGIKAGIFDSMKSSLLDKIKIDLTKKEDKMPVTIKLNESSDPTYFQNLVKYSPIGIEFQDIKNNRMIILTESCILQFDYESKKLSVLNESIVGDIPDSHLKLISAINTAPYSVEKNSFSLNENWDFNLELTETGSVLINNKEIPSEKVQSLLMESINTYENDPSKYPDFNKMNFLQDADRFISLMENEERLIKLDNIEVIKNLNENSFVMYDKKSVFEKNQPEILFSSDKQIPMNKLFESYSELNMDMNKVLGTNVVGLFESQIQKESESIIENQNKISNLMESQNELNTNITKVKSLISIADPNSPAYDKLNEQYNQLNLRLEENLKNLNECKNNFKLI